MRDAAAIVKRPNEGPRLERHLYTHASGRPACLFCSSYVTKRVGGWKGREAVARAEKQEARALPDAKAFECRACFRTFVMVNDPTRPSGRLA
jgi:hypothetical protein